MLASAAELKKKYPQLSFVLPVHNTHISDLVEEGISTHCPASLDCKSIEIKVGTTQEWMKRASAGIAASGTITIEAAILDLPLVVMYKINSLTYAIARRLVNVKHITMTNLVADKCVFEEYIQNQIDPTGICESVEAILPQGNRRSAVLSDLAMVREKLGAGSEILKETANVILSTIDSAAASPFTEIRLQ
jgi:lipid-A-disaccharide synthase